MANDSTQVIATRDMIVQLADFATSNAMPADTVAWGDAWGGTFAEAGYTNGGLQASIAFDRTDIRVDQELDPVYRVATGRTLTMGTTLSQITPANIKRATGAGSITTVAPSTGVRGHDDLAVGSTIVEQYYSVGYDIRNPGDGEAFRFLVFKGLPTGSPTIGFTAEAPAGIDFQVTALPDTSTTPTRVLLIRDVSAAA